MLPVTQQPRIQKISMTHSYQGTPGARIHQVHFDDGLQINVAKYSGKSDKPPVVVVPGYTTSMGYLHPFAREVQKKGFSVTLVQPPGQGKEPIAKSPQSSDSYASTIEGFSVKYLPALSKAISEQLYNGAKLYLMGHSRAGYMMRLMGTGLKYVGKDENGRPLLQYSEEGQKELNQFIHGLATLFSPIKVNEDLTQVVLRLSELIAVVQRYETFQEMQQEILHQGLDMMFFAQDAWMKIFGIDSRKIRRNETQKLQKFIEQRQAQLMAALLRGNQDVSAILMMLGAARMNPLFRDVVPSHEQFRDLIELNRDLLSPDPNERKRIPPESLIHTILYGSGSAHPAATKELKTMREPTSWQTQGFDLTTRQPIRISDLAIQSRTAQIAPPLDFIHAEHDGFLEAFESELGLDNRSRGILIQGGTHLGSLFHPEHVRQIVNLIEERLG